MSDILKLKKSNCKNCYKCIRHCPVKSIKFSNDQANIVTDECVLCGMCFVSCPQNAKEIRNDIPVAKDLIESGAPVYASIAPAFVANYDGITIASVRNALKKLGFADASETAQGAMFVKTRYDEMVNEKKSSVIISSCCHTVNLLIQKYYPQALEFLAPVVSPMMAHCSMIKKEHEGSKTVFIGPCISKKDEARAYNGVVDCVLTFEELTRWLEAENIELEKTEEDDFKGKTRIFPTSGGILRSMECKNPDYNYLTVDGMDNCIQALEDILAGGMENCFIEMSACAGSCIGGPIMEKYKRGIVRDYITVNNYNGKEDYPLDMPTERELFKNIQYMGTKRSMPGTREIEEVLKKMGKTKPEDELNCGSCGYNTCREKAIAVCQGKADISMCLPFLCSKAQTFSDNIIYNTPNGIFVLNEELQIQQINKAARKILNISNADNVIGEPVIRLLDPLPYMDVLESGVNVHDKKSYLADYRRYIEQSIIYDKSYHLLICIIKDITAEEKAKEQKDDISRQTIEITDKVIEKQMRIVQEIASLLGETTAETKIALTKLKESLEDE